MPQKQKLSQNKKLNLVQKILNGELGIGEAARIAKVSKTSVQRWLDRYEVEGATGFLPQEKNRVYSPEVKLSAVQDYLSGKGSLIDVCKKYKIKRDNQLLRWIEVYNAHGDFNFVKYSGGSYMKQGRETTQEERIRIAKECYASGKNYGEIALKYNVSYQQARTWTLRYEELGEIGLEDRRGRRKKDQEPRTPLEEAQIEIERLKHELHKAEMERDLLKKLDEVVRRDAYRK